MGVESISVNPSRQTHTCSICHSPQKKNGKTPAGTQRWRCKNCDASTTYKRPDTTARNQLTAHVGWLMSKQSHTEYATTSARTFRRHTAWCWNVHPHLNHTGEVFDEIQVDGIYLKPGWCLLIAIANKHVIGWQWCDREKSAAWTELLRHFPEPKVVVTDGGSGLMKALKTLWPTVKIQRCLVHIQRNIRTYLTINPKTSAGRSLRGLSLKLTGISTLEQAQSWLNLVNNWYTEYKDYINEKTYATDWVGERPAGITSNRTWWYTHTRVRSAYETLRLVIRREHLFTYLDPDLEDSGINPTTNMIEGAINSGIRRILRDHRGMRTEHRRTAAEWFCWTHAEPAGRPSLGSLVKPEHYAPQLRLAAVQEFEEQVGPELYDTATIAEEGLYARQGWGGRSQ